MKIFKLLICLAAAVIFGCAKPDKINRIPSPNPSVFLTVEIFYGEGAISSDSTFAYLSYEGQGKSIKRKVLSGTYLEIKNIYWASETELNICISSGIVDAYTNQVTLETGERSSKTIRIYLPQRKC